ncbi:MAG: hypothetical protein CMQ88_04220 [Gammaproteobacteria bacterium]|nr:hypothetical protein [Gammaproteobacteria bacterium]
MAVNAHNGKPPLDGGSGYIPLRLGESKLHRASHGESLPMRVTIPLAGKRRDIAWGGNTTQ